MEEQQLKYWLAWNKISLLGAKRFYKLLEYFGTVEEAWRTKSEEIIKLLNLPPASAEKIFQEKDALNVDKELELLNRYQIKVVTVKDASYPERLKQISFPPPVLYYRGSIIPDDRYAISIVGSRKATYYGKMVAENLSKDLASFGLTIISGMARGIDTAAHIGALAMKGRTLAVLGSGLNQIYPPENRRLAEEIESYGAIISEFSLFTKPERQNFPRRNRIISGLSLGVIVVEADEKSGALITADFALEQGREVFAVPGNVNSSLSKGTHNLIKQGAKLVHNYEDILEELPLQINQRINKKKERINQSTLDEEEKIILQLINQEPVHIDQIITFSHLPVSKVSEILLKLELKDLIKEISGKKFIRL